MERDNRLIYAIPLIALPIALLTTVLYLSREDELPIRRDRYKLFSLRLALTGLKDEALKKAQHDTEFLSFLLLDFNDFILHYVANYARRKSKPDKIRKKMMELKAFTEARARKIGEKEVVKKYLPKVLDILNKVEKLVEEMVDLRENKSQMYSKKTLKDLLYKKAGEIDDYTWKIKDLYERALIEAYLSYS